MIEIIHKKNKNSDKLIIETLRTYNKKYVLNSVYEEKFFYAFENGNIFGMVHVKLEWDWITIKKGYYKDLNTLSVLVEKTWQYFMSKAVGIKFFSSDSSQLEDFTNVGFVHHHTVSYAHENIYYADFVKCVNPTQHLLKIKMRSKPMYSYMKDIHDHPFEYKKTHTDEKAIDSITFTAQDDQKFTGGLIADVFKHSIYLEYLSVIESYRLLSIGKK